MSFAIIGIGCRFPGRCTTPKEFYDFLLRGQDAIGPIPDSRWDRNSFYDANPQTRGKIHALEGGFIAEVSLFDPAFFGISPIEAERMDPQQRLLLETSYRALEDAGMKLDQISGSKMGVFVGISTHDYGDIQQSSSERGNIGAHTNTGSASSIAANRLSYFYNLLGPSVAIDTACSSSLTALHLAVSSLQNGECTHAMVGGINLILKPEPQMGFCRGGFLAPDSRCKSFDASANGYVRSEGVGVVILKSTQQALADGDRIYAEVLATAINQDGRTQGITVPSLESQKRLLQDVYQQARVKPERVSYIEAHGTGTPIGDRIEALSLGSVFSVNRNPDNPLYLGSVKSQVGHLEAGSGMAGLIKTALCIHYGNLPAQLHFQTPNPQIPWNDLKMKVVTGNISWPKSDRKIAGVNSFGFGGSNAHVVLAETKIPKKIETAQPETLQLKTLQPGASQISQATPQGWLVVVSGFRQEDLAKKVRDLIDWLGSTVPITPSRMSLPEISYSSIFKQSHFKYKLSVWAKDIQQFRMLLQDWLLQRANPSLLESKVLPGKRKLVLVFSGQGSQWWAMGRGLLKQEGIFLETIKEIDELFHRLAKFSILEALLADNEQESKINQTEIAQPCLFAIQVALYRLWKQQGLVPDAVVGHSVGEVAAAHVSGALSLTQAVQVIFHRSQIQAQADGHGLMLAVGLSADSALSLIPTDLRSISLAADNGPQSITLAGSAFDLRSFAQLCEERGIFHRFLPVTVPFHSVFMDPLKEQLKSALKSLKPNPHKTMIVSTVTGQSIEGQALNCTYWVKNMRDPVLFRQAIEHLLQSGFDTFVEVGPHPILSTSLSDIGNSQNRRITLVGSLNRREVEEESLVRSLLSLSGAGVDFAPNVWPSTARSQWALPHYPFQRKSFWLESVASKLDRIGHREHPFIKRKLNSALHSRRGVWEIDLDVRQLPYLRDHRVQGPIVFPGTGQMEVALAVASTIQKGTVFGIEGMDLVAPVFLPEEGEPARVQCEVYSDEGNFVISSKIFQGEAGEKQAMPMTHSKGRLFWSEKPKTKNKLPIAEIRNRLADTLEPEKLFQELRLGGLQLGPNFQGTHKIHWGPNEALIEILTPNELLPFRKDHHVHPVVLDAALQMAAAGTYSQKSPGELYLPIHVERLEFFDQPSDRVFAHIRIRQHDSFFIRADIDLTNEQGEICLSLRQVVYKYIEGTREITSGSDQSSPVVPQSYSLVWNLRDRVEATRNRIAEFLPSPTEFQDAADHWFRTTSNTPSWQKYHYEFEPELDQLCYQLMLEALLALAKSDGNSVDREFNFDKVKEDLVIGKYHRLWDHWIQTLLDQKFIHKTPDNLYALSQELQPKSSQSKIDLLLQNYPEFKAELTLVARCGDHLDAVVSGKSDPIQLLFPESDWDSVVQYYSEAQSFAPYNTLLSGILRNMLEALPKNRCLRILEVGGGTGGITQSLLPLLSSRQITYTFTDCSPEFLRRAKRRFHNYKFVQYQLFDLEKDAKEQGLEPESFDLILASDVVHATTDVKKTLTSLRELLSQNGLLGLLEVTKSPRYLDLTFALTEGWWAFADTQRRCTSPLLSSSQWQSLLHEIGLTETAIYSDAVNESQSAQSFILAQKPLRESNTQVQGPPRSKDTSHSQPDTRSWLIVGSPDDVVANWVQEQLNRDTGSSLKDSLTLEQSLKQTLKQSWTDLNDAFWPTNLSGILVFCNHTEEKATLETTIQKSLALASIYRSMKQKSSFVPLWIITQGSQMVLSDDRVNAPLAGSFWGLGRVAGTEISSLPTRLLDLSPRPSEEELSAFLDEIHSQSSEEERALRGNSRWIGELYQDVPPEQVEAKTIAVTARGTSYHLQSQQFGSLENLRLVETELTDVGPHEVIVEPRACGLNFKDILIAMNLLEDSAIAGGVVGRRFGMECAGLVQSVGTKVTEFKKGDSVLGLIPDCFSGKIKVHEDFLAPIPKNLTLSQAAALPVVYLTAYYGLFHLAQAEAGETILIHSAAGGVGLAAIYLCQQKGLRVIATVGNEEKKAYLLGLGVKDVFNSRDLRFKGQVLQATQGRGVNLVLNSLSGDAMTASLECLAAFGRFVEIGKTELYRNKQIGLRPFGNNISYFVVDVDRLQAQKPELTKRLFREVIGFIELHKIPSHPITSFPVTQAPEAMRLLSRGQTLGKVIVEIPEGQIDIYPLPNKNESKRKISKDGSYLVTGGTQGFGLHVAQFLANQGAGRLILFSRSGGKDSPDLAEKIKQMQEIGAEVMVFTGDVTRIEDLQKAVISATSGNFTLRGLFHCAMVLQDGPLLNLTKDDWLSVFAPKVQGALNLGQIARSLNSRFKLDYFVLFSSMASIYGNAGQANYAASNAMLDSFTYQLRQEGLPAQVINWGVIGDTGFVARNVNVQKILDSQGWKSIPVKEALKDFDQVLKNGDRIQSIFLKADWIEIGKYFPNIATSNRFQTLMRESSAQENSSIESSLKMQIQHLDTLQKSKLIEKKLGPFVARVLGVHQGQGIGSLDIETSLVNQGLDSLMANQVSNWIKNNFGLDYSMMKLMRGLSLAQIAKELAELFNSVSLETSNERSPLLTSPFLTSPLLTSPLLPIAEFKDSEVQLIAFPYLGGDAELYECWKPNLKGNFDLLAVRMPKPGDSNPSLFLFTERLHEELKKRPQKRTLFYGHSFGAWLAYEVTRRLRKLGWTIELLIVAASPPPTIDHPLFKRQSDEVLLQQLGQIGLRQTTLTDTIRKQLELVEEMRVSPRSELDLPIRALYGTSDTHVQKSELQEWAKFSILPIEVQPIPGGHLFLEENPQVVLLHVDPNLTHDDYPR